MAPAMGSWSYFVRSFLWSFVSWFSSAFVRSLPRSFLWLSLFAVTFVFLVFVLVLVCSFACVRSFGFSFGSFVFRGACFFVTFCSCVRSIFPLFVVLVRYVRFVCALVRSFVRSFVMCVSIVRLELFLFCVPSLFVRSWRPFFRYILFVFAFVCSFARSFLFPPLCVGVVRF